MITFLILMGVSVFEFLERLIFATLPNGQKDNNKSFGSKIWVVSSILYQK